MEPVLNRTSEKQEATLFNNQRHDSLSQTPHSSTHLIVTSFRILITNYKQLEATKDKRLNWKTPLCVGEHAIFIIRICSCSCCIAIASVRESSLGENQIRTMNLTRLIATICCRTNCHCRVYHIYFKTSNHTISLKSTFLNYQERSGTHVVQILRQGFGSCLSVELSVDKVTL